MKKTQHTIATALLLAGSAAALSASPACCDDGGAFAEGEMHAEETVTITQTAAHNLGLETAAATRGTIEETIFALGKLDVLPRNQAVVSSRVAGRVASIEVYEGERVEKGQTVLVIETRQIGDPPPKLELKAPLSGVIASMNVRLGEPVEPDKTLAEIVDWKELYAVANVVAGQAAGLDKGQKARVRAEAFPQSVFQAEMQRFGESANAEANTLPVYFNVANGDGKLRPGMRVRFHIITGAEENAILVPREALLGEHGNHFVYTADPAKPLTFNRMPVRVGMRNDRHIAVHAGVEAGESVVTKGGYLLQFAGAVGEAQLSAAAEAAHGHSHGPGGHDHDAEEGHAPGGHPEEGEATPEELTSANGDLAVEMDFMNFGAAAPEEEGADQAGEDHGHEGHDHAAHDHAAEEAEHDHAGEDQAENSYLVYGLSGSVCLLLGLLVMQSVRSFGNRRDD